MEPHSPDETPEVPRPTLWPVGFAIGVACMLVGFVVSWPAVGVGAAIALVFGALWFRDVTAGRRIRSRAQAAPTARPADPAPPLPAHKGPRAMPSGERFPRSKLLEGATLGLGAVIGGAVTAPAVGLAIVPTFLKQGHKDIDLGPLSEYPESQWKIVHFFLDAKEGEVTRRVAYVRYNGLLGSEPSFTIISNRCAHLGCPVQPNGLALPNQTKDEQTKTGFVQVTPVSALAGFGCPCHGGAYDTEGNRTAGPPVRGLDRFEFSIRRGRLYLGRQYSVKTVKGTGAQARIHRYDLVGPGQHVGDWESWLYPIQPPH